MSAPCIATLVFGRPRLGLAPLPKTLRSFGHACWCLRPTASVGFSHLPNRYGFTYAAMVDLVERILLRRKNKLKGVRNDKDYAFKETNRSEFDGRASVLAAAR